MLNNKFLTRLLGNDYRHSFLAKSKHLDDSKKQIKQYAQYVIDSQMKSRDIRLKDIKKMSYGFQPINFLCAVMDDGTVSNKLFEFKQVNHFLKDDDIEAALEVVQCILLQILDEDKHVESFDVGKIDAYLKSIEEQYLKSNGKRDAKDGH